MSDNEVIISDANVRNAPVYRLVASGGKTHICEYATNAPVYVIDGEISGGAQVMTTEERLATTPDEGKLIYDSELEAMFVGDGVTPGGVLVGGGGEGTVTGIEASVSGNTATIEATGSTTSVNLVGAGRVALTENASGDIVITGQTYTAGTGIALVNGSTITLTGTTATAAWNSGDGITFVNGNTVSYAANYLGKYPFVPSAVNPYRYIMKNIQMFGALDKSHQYALTRFTLEVYSTFSRMGITIRDLTSNVDVCQTAPFIKDSEGNPVTSVEGLIENLPNEIFLSASTASVHTYALLSIDKSKIDYSTFPHDFTVQHNSYSERGIHPDAVHPPMDCCNYIEDNNYQELITVGPVGTGAMFTSLRAAIESLYVDKTPETGTVYPMPKNFHCARASYSRKIRVQLSGGTFSATSLWIPPWVEIVGEGADRTFIVRENLNPYPVLQVPLQSKVRNLTIQSDSNHYCIHSDMGQTNDPDRDNVQQLFKNVVLIGGSTQNAWLFGCGVIGGEHIVFDGVSAWHTRPPDASSDAAFGFHNTEAARVPSSIVLRGCNSKDFTKKSLTLASNGNHPCTCTIENSDFHCVFYQNSINWVTENAYDMISWDIRGDYDGPIDYEITLEVLKVPAGYEVSGTAKEILFGEVDELGYGNQLIREGTVHAESTSGGSSITSPVSLAARLGDCSAVGASKTLTINGASITLEVDFSAMTNAQVIAAINTELGQTMISQGDLGKQIYADTGYTRRMTNRTGATIPKGRFVARDLTFVSGTGNFGIKLAGPDDEIFGWTIRDILNGSSGDVIITKRVHFSYIYNSTGIVGAWGVNANGEIDGNAEVKKGIINDGFIEIF